MYDTNYTIFHDKESVDNPTKDGFQRGGVETSSEGANQYCHPKKNSSRILWHTHPRGSPAYPSGSDLFVVMVRDCSGKRGMDSTAQSYIEFLFTEHGFWIIHRGVDENNVLIPSINITKGARGKIKMRDIEKSIDDIEDKVIRPEYRRTRTPSKRSAEILGEFLRGIGFADMVHVSFHGWEEASGFVIPMALFEAEISEICPVE